MKYKYLKPIFRKCLHLPPERHVGCVTLKQVVGCITDRILRVLDLIWLADDKSHRIIKEC